MTVTTEVAPYSALPPSSSVPVSNSNTFTWPKSPTPPLDLVLNALLWPLKAGLPVQLLRFQHVVDSLPLFAMASLCFQ